MYRLYFGDLEFDGEWNRQGQMILCMSSIDFNLNIVQIGYIHVDTIEHK